MKKHRKLLDLSDECVKQLTKDAVDNDTKFKLYAERILEEAAKKSIKKKS